ncbi:EAL domain-containing protein [Actinoplanes sp. NPDC051343]|uniref:EAL domain-containing protein n=1 Tax=Actinoplanes sp. NPDC051343 TaxID=3363906 RepID=UPI0037BAAD2E
METIAVAEADQALMVHKSDPQLDRLLGLARKHLAADVAWLVSGDQVIVNGGPVPLPSAFALPTIIPDARHLGLGWVAGVPLDGLDGMVCCAGLLPDPALDESALRPLGLAADLIAEHLGSPAAHARREASRNETVVRQILAAGAARSVVQPVVRLQDGVIVAYEALARFDPAVFATPDRAFAAAEACGLGLELELLALSKALEQIDSLPPGIWLGLNLSAATVADPRTQELLLSRPDANLGVEITEHTPIADYQKLNADLLPLRTAGINIVVDDAGAGFASLSHILQLRPDTIKLDISLVRGIHSDPVRRALARSLVGFAHEIGAALIAEGVETEEERATLAALGAVYGQGYLWGRPA